MITGVRGSGKAVMLTDIAKHFRKEKDWIVVDLSPESDLLQMQDQKVSSIRAKAEKNSSSFGVYRDRLIKKGIIVACEYGHLDFALPRFKEFVYRMK